MYHEWNIFSLCKYWCIRTMSCLWALYVSFYIFTTIEISYLIFVTHCGRYCVIIIIIVTILIAVQKKNLAAIKMFSAKIREILTTWSNLRYFIKFFWIMASNYIFMLKTFKYLCILNRGFAKLNDLFNENGFLFAVRESYEDEIKNFSSLKQYNWKWLILLAYFRYIALVSLQTETSSQRTPSLLEIF